MVSVSSQRSLASNGPHESPTIRCRRRTTCESLAGTGRSSWHHDNPSTTSLPCSVVDNPQWNHGPSLKMENGWHDPRTILLQHKQYLTVAKSIRHIFQERGLHIGEYCRTLDKPMASLSTCIWAFVMNGNLAKSCQFFFKSLCALFNGIAKVTVVRDSFPIQL